jgi:hypothetical protein
MAAQEHSKGEGVVTLTIDPIAHPHAALSKHLGDEPRPGSAKRADHDRALPPRSLSPEHSGLSATPRVGRCEMTWYSVGSLGQNL